MALTPITTKRRMRRFLTYDLEWVPGSLAVRVVGCFDGIRYRSYRTVRQFLHNQLNSKNRGAWFYAHAGGLADVQFVFEEIIRSGEYICDASFSGSSAIIVHIRQGKNVWHFVDSYWLLRDKLSNIAKFIGGKKTGPAENPEWTQEQIKHWYATAPLDELTIYNRNDCEILWHAIDNFETALLGMGGQLQMTVAANAMQLFRRAYLTKEIGTSDSVNERARKAYFASRVEVFNSDCVDSYYYDINSSFSYAMIYPAPGELCASYSKLPDRLLQKPFDNPFMADCSFTVADSYLPPIPTRIGGRVFFPVGSWRSWITSVDLDLILKEGGKINKVYEVMEFEPFHDLSNYATDLYNKRKASTDDFERIVYKYMLNSLYGKFAESSEKQRMHIDPSEKVLNRIKKKFGQQAMLMPKVWVEVVNVPVPHMHVPISAHITAIARRNLFEHMKKSNNDVHYCDTDGFSTTHKYRTGKELGDLKLEKKEVSADYIGPKVYKMRCLELNSKGKWERKTITKAKGFSLGSGDEAEKRFDMLVSGREIKVDRMSRIRENFKRGTVAPNESTITKALRTVIPKRFTYPNGSTRPWTIEELRTI